MLSCSYTLAYNIALVESLTPLLAPLLDRVFFKTPLPKGIFQVIGLSIFGCIVVAFAQSPSYYVFVGEKSPYSWRVEDAIGLSMSFVSVLCLNLARIVMKTSEGTMTPTEGLQVQNILTVLISVTISFSAGSGEATWSRSLSSLMGSIPVILSFLFLTLGILSGALWWEVVSVRSLGPGAYGSMSSIRVPVAVLGSYLMMEESVQNWFEWIGILTIIVTMTIYVAKTEGRPVDRVTNDLL